MNYSAALFLLLAPVFAETVYPPATWSANPSPLASDLAEPGGRLRMFAMQYPKSFNYYLDQNVFNARLFGMMYETLIGMNPITQEPEPALARRFVISDDKQTFTFHLDPAARWSDGTPVTADDVVYTWHAVMKDEHLTGAHKVSLDKFEPPVKLDAHTVQFRAKDLHWKNLWNAGGFEILPRHVWESRDFNTVNFDFPVVSGPWRVLKISEPHSLLLGKREDYWSARDPRGDGLDNFDEVEFLFYSDRDLAYEKFKQGSFDLFSVYTSQRWVGETAGDRFDQNWIIKQAVVNRSPIGFQGFAMNLRRPIFQDARVRLALAHLLDRPRMNETFMYNQYFLHKSYWEDLYDAATPCPNPEIAFDVDRARALLAEAGWTVNASGKLEKDGREFVINFLTRDGSAERFVLLYREALERAGIDLRIVRKDLSSWSKDMDEYNFDMTWASWGAGLFKDPESMWHSKYAAQPSGHNLTGFTNPEVDALIDGIRGEFDLQARLAAIRKIDAILTHDVPYILLWNLDYTRLLYWNKFGTPPHVLGKFSDEFASRTYWWLDPDAEADLEAARAQNLKLPGRPARVVFDEMFTETLPQPPLD